MSGGLVLFETCNDILMLAQSQCLQFHTLPSASKPGAVVSAGFLFGLHSFVFGFAVILSIDTFCVMLIVPLLFSCIPILRHSVKSPSISGSNPSSQSSFTRLAMLSLSGATVPASSVCLINTESFSLGFKSLKL